MVWIRTLGAYYCELLDSDSDYEITWKDDSEVIEEVKSIQIEVNKPSQSELANDLQFKITIFLKTGTIQAQGRNFEQFEKSDFPILINIVNQTSVETSTIPDTETTKCTDQTKVKTPEITDETESKLLMGSESCNENETVKNSTNSQIQGTPENLIAMIQEKLQRQFDDLKSNIDKNKQVFKQLKQILYKPLTKHIIRILI